MKYQLFLLWIVTVPSYCVAQGETDDGAKSEDVIVAGGIEFQFATVDRGRKLLGQVDRFVKQMTPFDRQARLKTSDDPGQEKYLQFIQEQVLDWPSKERKAVANVIRSLDTLLQRVPLPELAPVYLVHVTGLDESNAAYTRGQAIVLPTGQLKPKSEDNRMLIAHELFHVLSRAHPKLRDELYAIIGFQPTNAISLPKGANDLRITNPDAPVVEHVMRVKLSESDSAFVAPITYSEEEYDASEKNSIFRYLKFQLLEVIQMVGKKWVAVTEDGKAKFHEPSIPDFHRQIGANTRYIIHPEEIMAVNFSLLVNEAEVKDTWVVDRMRQTLAQYGRGENN